MAQWVKNPPAMQETQEKWISSLGWEDPLEEEMATHSNILAWKIPWTEEPNGLQFKGLQRVRHNWAIQEMKEMQVESLEEEMATHSNILAWKIPWTEEPGRL